jgi:hypothetical protein
MASHLSGRRPVSRPASLPRMKSGYFKDAVCQLCAAFRVQAFAKWHLEQSGSWYVALMTSSLSYKRDWFRENYVTVASLGVQWRAVVKAHSRLGGRPIVFRISTSLNECSHWREPTCNHHQVRRENVRMEESIRVRRSSPTGSSVLPSSVS